MDVIVDITLLLMDVIMSPVLIVVGLVGYVIGDWITDVIKRGVKSVVHWFQRQHPVVRRIIVIIFLIALPFILILLWVFSSVWDYVLGITWDK